MKVMLYMGTSINGYIATKDGDSTWTSEEDLQGFREHSKEIGNCVMGKNTYESAVRDGIFPFPDVLNVIVSHKLIENTWGNNVLITNKSPRDIIVLLEQKGFQSVFLIGGGQLNSSFVKEGLIDEIYIDVEPLVIGEGIQVFTPSDFEYELKLVDIKKLNEDTVQLHYQVLK